jgi:transcriptional regulator with XRE-family HTH domain
MTMTNQATGRGYSDADRRFRKEFGERLRACRIAAGYPRPVDLARALGSPDLSNSTIASIETGGFFPKPLRVLELARGLGVTASYLLGDADNDVEYAAGYRAALADLEDAMHQNLKQLRRKGQ